MFQIVLYQPEIPPNTGNILRLAANTGCRLHLVRPLGFSLGDKALARAGMDYRERVALSVHDDWPDCLAALGHVRVFALSTRGEQRHDLARYAPGDALLFGAETRGLPEELLASLPPAQRIRLPMRAGSRSLNLANAVAVVVYEAWRQQGYASADQRGETL